MPAIRLLLQHRLVLGLGFDGSMQLCQHITQLLARRLERPGTESALFGSVLARGRLAQVGQRIVLVLIGEFEPRTSLELLNQSTFALAAGSLVGSASLLPGGIGAAEGTVAAVLDLVARQPRDVAAAATLLIRVCTLWFGVALGAASLVALARRLVTH